MHHSVIHLATIFILIFIFNVSHYTNGKNTNSKKISYYIAKPVHTYGPVLTTVLPLLYTLSAYFPWKQSSYSLMTDWDHSPDPGLTMRPACLLRNFSVEFMALLYFILSWVFWEGHSIMKLAALHL